MNQIPLMDITDRIAELPKWWIRGIPRYCDYHPNEGTRHPIQLLVRMNCQWCGREFVAAIGTSSVLAEGLKNFETGHFIEEAHEDPPFHLGVDGFNCGGNSMLSTMKEVLQVWKREYEPFRYVRQTEFEGPVQFYE